MIKCEVIKKREDIFLLLFGVKVSDFELILQRVEVLQRFIKKQVCCSSQKFDVFFNIISHQLTSLFYLDKVSSKGVKTCLKKSF
ncbi:MAG: hypothetical protein LBB21_01035 [Holosporaceae bacterium]|jgi:hypothetical protein|nr:hypothetical protein [Holosporaceae bacterium]